jgi:hypothetical protein
VVIELWAVEAFCLTPVIACLFFVGWCVVYVGDASVAIDGVIKNQLDKYATGCNTQR